MNRWDDLTDELISAYFDGELSADERARAEYLLAHDEGRRRDLDELAGLRSDMRALPHHKLGEGFCRNVLRVAAIAGPLDRAGRDRWPAEFGERKAADVVGGESRRRSHWWTYSVAAAAVAASLLLMLCWPRQPHPPGETASAPVAANQDFAAANRSVRPGQDAAESRPTRIRDVPSKATGIGHDAPASGTAAIDASQTVAPAHGAVVKPAEHAGPARPAAEQPAADAFPIARAPADARESLAAIRNAQYLFVVETALTPSGRDSRAFDNVLADNLIRYDRSLEVDKPLEEALLASRFLSDAVRAELPEVPRLPEDRGQTRSNVELIYVVAAGGQIEQAAADLVARREEFVAVKFNLAVKPADLKVFEHLRRASSLQFVEAGEPSARASGHPGEPSASVANQLGRARRLIMQVTLLSRWGRTLWGAGLISDSGRSTGPLEVLSNRLPRPARSPRTGEPRSAELDAKYEVLFVVHLPAGAEP